MESEGVIEGVRELGVESKGVRGGCGIESGRNDRLNKLLNLGAM